MIINFNNIGNTGGGGGGGYVLPTATANRLGGIKVGSGLTVTNAGVLSAEEATVIDLAALSAMTSADRIALWDEVYVKVSANKSVFIKGLVQGEADRTAILPVVSYRPETTAATHEGGNIFFGAKGDTDNIYFHINFGSDGSILPAEGMAKTAIAKTAGADTLGMVKVGSGLSIDANGVLSATGGGGGNSNYHIVDNLNEITNPVEGDIAYVRSSSAETEYSCIYFTNPENLPTEDYVGWIYDTEDENPDNKLPVYFSDGNSFHWDYVNDGKWHTREFNGQMFEYRCVIDGDIANSEFQYRFPVGSTLAMELSDSGKVASDTASETVWKYSQPVLYQDSEWVMFGSPIFEVEYNGFPTSAQTAEFVEKVRDYLARGLYPRLSMRGHIFDFNGNSTDWVSFESVFYYNQCDTVYFSDTIFNDNGFDDKGFRYDQRSFCDFTQGEAIPFMIDNEGVLNGGASYNLWNAFQDNLIHRCQLTYEYLSPCGESLQEMCTKYTTGAITNYEQKDELYEVEDGEGGFREEVHSTVYFEGDITIDDVLYHGRWRVSDNELNGNDIEPVYFAPAEGAYVDINIDITDPDDIHLVRPDEEDEDSIGISLNALNFLYAAAGMQKMSAKPFRINYFYSGSTIEIPADFPVDINRLAGIDRVDSTVTLPDIENVYWDVFAEVYAHVPVPVKYEISGLGEGEYPYLDTVNEFNDYYIQLHVDPVFDEERPENKYPYNGDLRSDVVGFSGSQFHKDYKNVWIAVDSDGMYDSGNSIYTIEEFGDAMGSRNLDENPIRFYYSGITGYPVEDFEYGKIEVITRNPNAQTADYDNFGFAFTLPCGDNVYLCKTFLEVSFDGQGNKTGYYWSPIDKELLYSLNNPN